MYKGVILIKILQDKTSSVEDILENWTKNSDQYFEMSKISRELVKNAFKNVRMNWMLNNTDEWLKMHKFYDNAIETFKMLYQNRCNLYICTTKDKKFTLKLLEFAGLLGCIHEENIFGDPILKKLC